MFRVALAALVTCLFIVSAASVGSAAVNEKKRFSVEGLFSIDAPTNGYIWSEREIPAVKGTKVKCFTLTKDGSKTLMVLTVELRSPMESPVRVASVKAHYNGVMESFREKGFTELKSTRPIVDPPIPDNVSFIASGKKPDGHNFFLHSLTKFRRDIYLFQVMGESKDEVDSLVKIAESMTELPLSAANLANGAR